MLPERKSCGASPPCQECRKLSCHGWGWGLIYTGSLKFRIWRVDRANGEYNVICLGHYERPGLRWIRSIGMAWAAVSSASRQRGGCVPACTEREPSWHTSATSHTALWRRPSAASLPASQGTAVAAWRPLAPPGVRARRSAPDDDSWAR